MEWSAYVRPESAGRTSTTLTIGRAIRGSVLEVAPPLDMVLVGGAWVELFATQKNRRQQVNLLRAVEVGGGLARRRK